MDILKVQVVAEIQNQIIIGIIQEIKENITNFLDLDNDIIHISKENPKSAYVLQYPVIDIYKQKAAVSYGVIKDIEEEYNIIHCCCTEEGSSGSPILN